LSEIESFNRQPMKSIPFFTLSPAYRANIVRVDKHCPAPVKQCYGKEKTRGLLYKFGLHFTNKCSILFKSCRISLKSCDIFSKSYRISLKSWAVSSKKCGILFKSWTASFKKSGILSKSQGISSKKYSIILSFYGRISPFSIVAKWHVGCLKPLTEATFNKLNKHYSGGSGSSANESLPKQWATAHFMNPKASLILII